MNARLFVGSALAVMLSIPARAQDFDGLIADAAIRAEIPSAWVRAVMRAESGGDPHAVSVKGAMGLMQIMPGTWRVLRHDLNLGADPFDPRDNIAAGAAYLRFLHDRYGDAGFLAAYNAGPARYDDHLATGRPLPGETRDYVATVVRLLNGGTTNATSLRTGGMTAAPDWREASLFAGPLSMASDANFLRAGDVVPSSTGVLFVTSSGERAP